MSSPEHAPQSAERAVEAAGDAARERQAELLRLPEHGVESAAERTESLENALHDAHEKAISREVPGEELQAAAPAAHYVRPSNSRVARKKAYKDIIRHTQAELPPASRAFSKVIHQPVVEKTSAVLGASVARPNAILFGALFALLLSGGVYLLAKYYDYTLSGFEAIGAFIIGWAVGVLVDLVRVALGKH